MKKLILGSTALAGIASLASGAQASDGIKLDVGGFSPEGYAVFGKITKGLDVLDKLEALAGPGDGPPTKQITIISARRK